MPSTLNILLSCARLLFCELAAAKIIIAKLTADSESSLSSASSSKKRAVSTTTVDKWILDHDKALNTVIWLKYEKANRYHVARLKCAICKQFVDKIRGSRNFSPAFIDGSANLRTSTQRN